LVQAFLKKWWVESDFKTPNLSLSLRLKVSGSLGEFSIASATLNLLTLIFDNASNAANITL
jgi:hypothetical protein